jgi:hypothetical protein
MPCMPKLKIRMTVAKALLPKIPIRTSKR